MMSFCKTCVVVSFWICTISELILYISGQIEHAYFTNDSFTWTEARKVCRMVGPQNYVNISRTQKRGWISASARFTPWLEYLGCFRVKDKIIHKTATGVASGTQIFNCSLHCSDNFYFGLQQSQCFCLLNTSLSSDQIKSPCSKTESTSLCYGDKNALCASDNYEKDNTGMSLYRKAKTEFVRGSGDCLGIHKRSNDHSVYIWSANCDSAFNQICLDYVLPAMPTFTNKDDSKLSWAKSTKLCHPSVLLPHAYFSLKDERLTPDAYYWLGNIRRKVFEYHNVSSHNAEFCVMAEVADGGKVYRYLKSCRDTLPVLCLGVMGSNNDDNNIHGDDNKITISLSIILAVAGVLIVVVIVVVIIVIKTRRNRPDRKIGVLNTGNNAVYAEVNKPIKIKPPQDTNKEQAASSSCDTYDHVNHCRSDDRLSEVQQNDYDTMRSIEVDGENEYDHTNKQGKVIVTNDTEYSEVHIE